MDFIAWYGKLMQKRSADINHTLWPMWQFLAGLLFGATVYCPPMLLLRIKIIRISLQACFPRVYVCACVRHHYYRRMLKLKDVYTRVHVTAKFIKYFAEYLTYRRSPQSHIHAAPITDASFAIHITPALFACTCCPFLMMSTLVRQFLWNLWRKSDN